MDEVLQYIVQTIKNLDGGTLPDHADPAEPADIGSALTQEEIDTLKRFVKEIKERFNPL